MKILLTGCAGFIGSHLAEKLLEIGYDVLGIDNFNNYYSPEIKENNIKKALQNNNFKIIRRDILEIDLNNILKDIDFIFHLAAQPGVRYSWGEKFSLYVDNNIIATQKILEASRNNKIKKIIYSSSSSVYGDSEGAPIRETDKTNPVSPYGVTKLACEHLCNLYFENYGVPYSCLRYFTVYGERQRPDMAFSKFINNIYKGNEITIYGDGKQTRDFTYVSDVVDANILALNSKHLHETYNIGGGTKISLMNAIDIISEILNKKAILRNIESQKGDMKHTCANINKAVSMLGYKRKMDLREGLKKQIHSMIEE